jgi:hypothetical protein
MTIDDAVWGIAFFFLVPVVALFFGAIAADK